MDTPFPGPWKHISRHPRMLYWFWTPEILHDEKHLKDLKRIDEKSAYTMVVLSAREGMDFFDRSLIPHFEKAVSYAHRLGLKIVLQLWPEGSNSTIGISPDEAVSLVSEAEEKIPENGEVSLFCFTNSVRMKEIHTRLKSELLAVYAFKKMGDGKYAPGSLMELTNYAICHEADEGLSIRLSVPQWKGYTVYAMASHYYAYGDCFGDFFPRSFHGLLADLAPVGFDSFVLDEFRNITIRHQCDCFRDRLSGKAFSAWVEANTGTKMRELLFAMRYAPEGQESVRIRAINQYFSLMRQGPRRIERIFSEYVRHFCGENAFLGLHNTFHNQLQNDEIWATGCNWWGLPRQYAQTDENITMPVRLGISCECPEAICYDMFYKEEIEPFFVKAMEEAKFGSRIHYHAMNDLHWGQDLGQDAFLAGVNQVEKKIALLDWFDGPMPQMDLLIIVGMPALCNWYPNIRARNRYDIHGELNILERADALWKAGCRCALTSSEALDQGKIRMDATGFFYGEHHFTALLYVYPQYGTEASMDFLARAVSSPLPVRIIGKATHDFNGTAIPLHLRRMLGQSTLEEEADILADMHLPVSKTSDPCRLENGAYVFSDYASLKSGIPQAFSCTYGDQTYTGSYIGCAALLCNEEGQLERFACGGFSRLLCNGKEILAVKEAADVYWEKDHPTLQLLD